MSLLDWELNVDPNFFTHRFVAPKPVAPAAEMQEMGYVENWIAHQSDAFSAKELTVLPGKSVRIKDDGPYGAIVVQGHGVFGTLEIESPAQIRFGQMTQDEVFVTCKAAQEGITIRNASPTDPLVMLKHFGPKP